MSKTRILIVEDELIVAADLDQRLSRLGYETAGMLTRGDKPSPRRVGSGRIWS